MVFSNRTFMINDDVWMEAVLSGEYTGTPRNDPIFIKPPASWVLARAYASFPTIPWYGIMLMSSVIITFTCLLLITVRRLSSWGAWPFCVTALVAGLFTPPLLLTPTFTTSAAMMGVLAICLTLIFVDRPRDRKSPLILVSIAIAATGMSIRPEAGYAILIVFVPSVTLISALGNRRSGALRAFLFLAIGIFIINGSSLLDGKSREMIEYGKFNNFRGQLHDTPRLIPVYDNQEQPEIKQMLQENRWTIEDVSIFDNWFFDDNLVFDTNRIQRLVDVSASLDQPNLAEGFEMVWNQRELVLFLFGIGLFFCWQGNRLSGMATAFSLGWGLLIFSFIGRNRFPDRLALGLTIGVVTSIVWINGANKERAPTPKMTGKKTFWIRVERMFNTLTISVLLMVPALLVLNKFGPWEINESNRQKKVQLKSQVTALKEIDNDGIFIAVGAALPFDGVDPLRPSLFDDIKLFGTGWPTFSPASESRKKALGLSNPLPQSILNNKRLYVVAGPAQIELLKSYLSRRYFSDTEPILRGTLDNGIQVVKFGQAT